MLDTNGMPVGNMSMRVLVSRKLLTAAATDIVLDNLGIQKYEQFEIETWIKNAGGTDDYTDLFINGDFTSANYAGLVYRQIPANLSGGTLPAPLFCYAFGTNNSSGKGWMTIDPDGYFVWHHESENQSASGPGSWVCSGRYNTPIGVVNQAVLRNRKADGFDRGTLVKVWKWIDVTA